MRKLFFFIFFAGFLVLPLGKYSIAQEDAKELVEVIFEKMESIENNVRADQWSSAEAEIKQLEKVTKDLLSKVKPQDKETYDTRISHLIAAMQESVSAKEDEDLEVPYYAYQKVMLQLMEQMDYKEPPVFLFLDDHLKEAIEACEKGDFDRVSDEIEEFVNLREEARNAAAGNDLNQEQMNALIMLSLEVESACEREDKDLAMRHLTRMSKMLESFIKQVTKPS